MSRVGATTGSAELGRSMLLTLSITSRASWMARRERGKWTAVWSPSTSGLKAVHTGGGRWRGVRLDGSAVKENRLKVLVAQPMQGGGPVEGPRTLPDDLLQNIPPPGPRL